MVERTIFEWIRKSLEEKLFPPEPQGWIGEKIHSLSIKEDIKKMALSYTGRKIDLPKKEKEGD